MCYTSAAANTLLPLHHAHMDQLAVIDYVIIGVYMAGVLFIGSYFGKYVSTTGDLFLAGRSLPFWAIGMSIVVSDIVLWT